MIDKEIEILKEFIWAGQNIINATEYENQPFIKITQEDIKSIENVLKALEGKDCVIETLQHNEEVNEEMITKLDKDLETYKKIAEKLATYIEESEIMHKEKIPLDMNNPDGLSIVRVAKKEEIIKWAREEVDKDGSTNADKI